MTSAPDRILIADDSAPSRETLTMLFKLSGFAVTAAADGEEALELARSGGFDAVVLDVWMPKVDGLSVLRAIRATFAPTALPVVMATGDSHTEAVVGALEAGANDYVTKPYDFQVLLARVRMQLALKRAVEAQMALESSLAARNKELAAVNRQMRLDLEAAAHVQKALLPQVFHHPGARAAWAYHPCEELAGDGLNVFSLGRDHVGLYVLDVSGHGVRASLLSVALRHLLAPEAGFGSTLLWSGDAPAPPAAVLDHLNQRFRFDEATEQYFTILYALLDARTGEVRYASAGHPGPLVVSSTGQLTVLPAKGLPGGLSDDKSHEYAAQLNPGDRLVLYSDGVTDAPAANGERFGRERLLTALDVPTTACPEDALARLMRALWDWQGSDSPVDDISVLALDFLGPQVGTAKFD